MDTQFLNSHFKLKFTHFQRLFLDHFCCRAPTAVSREITLLLMFVCKQQMTTVSKIKRFTVTSMCAMCDTRTVKNFQSTFCVRLSVILLSWLQQRLTVWFCAKNVFLMCFLYNCPSVLLQFPTNVCSAFIWLTLCRKLKNLPHMTGFPLLRMLWKRQQNKNWSKFTTCTYTEMFQCICAWRFTCLELWVSCWKNYYDILSDFSFDVMQG